MLFKEFSTFSSGDHFVLRSVTICAILVEGIMGNIHVNYFKFKPINSPGADAV